MYNLSYSVYKNVDEKKIDNVLSHMASNNLDAISWSDLDTVVKGILSPMNRFLIVQLSYKLKCLSTIKYYES